MSNQSETTGTLPWNGPIDKDGNPYLGSTVWQGGPPVGLGDGGTFIPRPVYHDELAALMKVIARLEARVKELEDGR